MAGNSRVNPFADYLKCRYFQDMSCDLSLNLSAGRRNLFCDPAHRLTWDAIE